MNNLAKRANRVLKALRRSTTTEISEDIIEKNGFILLFRGSYDLFLVDKDTRRLIIIGYDGALITDYIVSEHFLSKLKDKKVEVEGIDYTLLRPYVIHYLDKEKDMKCVELVSIEGGEDWRLSPPFKFVRDYR